MAIRRHLHVELIPRGTLKVVIDENAPHSYLSDWRCHGLEDARDNPETPERVLTTTVCYGLNIHPD
jgi:hypothetical protein